LVGPDTDETGDRTPASGKKMVITSWIRTAPP
jgi:hypothetical protein